MAFSKKILEEPEARAIVERLFDHPQVVGANELFGTLKKGTVSYPCFYKYLDRLEENGIIRIEGRKKKGGKKWKIQLTSEAVNPGWLVSISHGFKFIVEDMLRARSYIDENFAKEDGPIKAAFLMASLGQHASYEYAKYLIDESANFFKANPEMPQGLVFINFTKMYQGFVAAYAIGLSGPLYNAMKEIKDLGPDKALQNNNWDSLREHLNKFVDFTPSAEARSKSIPYLKRSFSPDFIDAVLNNDKEKIRHYARKYLISGYGINTLLARTNNLE